jgi:hypothetical protein
MTKAPTFFVLLIATLCNTQVLSQKLYHNIKELTIVDSVSCQDIATDIYIGNGFCSDIFKVSSNMTFIKTTGCDVGLNRSIIDSGTWSIKNNSVVVLSSKKVTLYFDIIKFDRYYFFILPDQSQEFIKDFQSAKTIMGKFKGTKIGDTFIKANDLIQASLSKKYYVKEPADTIGT